MQEEDNYDDVRHIEESDMTVQSNAIDPNQKLDNSNINNQVDQSLAKDESFQNQNQIQIPEQENNLKKSLVSLSKDNDNPMSSMPDLSQIEDIQEVEQEGDEDLQMKQVITEVTDQRITISPQIELLAPTTQELMDKHKQVLKSPRRELLIDIQDKQSAHQEVPKINLDEKYQSSEQVIETNLKEIYNFYAKQAQSTNRQATFDQLYQTTNIITLQKFMYFCKDFNLIDLQITNNLILQLGGQPLQQRQNKLNKNKDHLTLNKFLLVEIYKKNCSSQQELNFQLFQQILQRMSEIMFPQQKSIYLFYQFLEIKEPKLYRKKMLIVGKPFNTKEQIEKITQEKLYARRIVLPPQPRAVTVKQEPVIPISIQEKEKPQKKQIKTLPKQQPLLQWEDLNDISKDFDPKELLLEQDLSDKEDDIYLMEYQIKKSTLIKSKKQLVESVKQITTLNNKGINQSYEIQPKESVKQRRKLNQMPTKALLNQSYEVSQRDEGGFMKKAQNDQKEREKQIYSAFLKKQTEREQRIKKK